MADRLIDLGVDVRVPFGILFFFLCSVTGNACFMLNQAQPVC